jgi:uncharacterized protein YdaL
MRSSLFGRKAIFSIFCLLAYLASVGSVHAANKQVLILHDSSGEWGYLGKEYSIMLKNLLGHFDASVTTKPVSSYTSGEINNQDATFYIGSTYDEESYLSSDPAKQKNYQDFLADAATTGKTVAWINHNLEELSRNWKPEWGTQTFSEKTGYNYIGIKNNAFNRVQYKGVELNKGVISWVNPGSDLTGCTQEGGTAYACSTRLHTLTITDSNKAETKATAYSSLNPNAPQEPYITRSGNFWFIGDMPFSFISEEDRYLAFADILHDIIDSGIGQQPLKAMVRLEDVTPGIDPVSLKEVMSYLRNQNVPFAIAAVSIFEDPKGILSEGNPTTVAMPNSEIAKTIAPFYNSGYASIVAHGLTHQFGNLDNPYNALSGDDFEFYRVTINSDNSLNFLGAVPNDSSQWARRRMRIAKAALRYSRFEPFAWEAPHYFATEADNIGIRSVFSTHYGRAVYFNNEGPAGRHIGQFYPYVIHSDHYGYRQIPENIGNIEPTPFLGYRALLPADLLRHAKKIKVVRDSVASFFYHPYLGTGYLNEVVQGLRELGYQFIEPCSLGSCPSRGRGRGRAASIEQPPEADTTASSDSTDSPQVTPASVPEESSTVISESVEEGDPEASAVTESASGENTEYTGGASEPSDNSGNTPGLYGDPEQIKAQAAADGNSGEPSPDTSSEPTSDAPGEPTPDSSSEPTSDAPGEPTPDTSGEPTSDAPSEPTPDSSGEPTPDGPGESSPEEGDTPSEEDEDEDEDNGNT